MVISCPTLQFTTEEKEENNEIGFIGVPTTLDDIVYDIITGTKDISEFDSVAMQAWNDGYAKLTANHQAAYDRYLAAFK